MEVEKLKTAVNQKKKGLEKVHVWSFYYEKDEKKYWCAHYSRFKKNTGAYIFSEETPSHDEILHAYKKMALSTSLFNRISHDMRDHYSKILVYFVDLRHLLQEWQKEAPIEANLFNTQIKKYLEVVHYYERTQQEIYDLHQSLNSGEALHLKLFREQQNDIFKNEFIPILRTNYFVNGEKDGPSN